MTVLTNTPNNLNTLSDITFGFSVKKAPHVNFFAQSVSIPEIILNPTNISNQFVKLPITGDSIIFGDLPVTFKVDEDLQNYMEIFNWIMGMGFPNDNSQYLNIENKSLISGQGIYSDISVVLYTGIKNPNVEFIFKDAWPFKISEMKLYTDKNDVRYVSVEVLFKYTLFTVQRII